MTQSFRELAEGATKLELTLRKGDVELGVVEGAEPTLSWDAEADEVPEVTRYGEVLSIKQPEELRGGRRMDVRLVLPSTIQDADVKTGLGEIAATGLRGAARLQTGNGEIGVKDFVGGELKIQSGNGEVKVEGARGHVRVSSGNGEIELTRVEGQIEANTGNGEIEIELAGPSQVRANSGMGDVEVKGEAVVDARVNTGKGDLECGAALLPGKHSFNTGMGDISVRLHPDASARVELQTGFGDVDSDFPLVRVGRSGPMGFGGARMVGSIGEGEPQVELTMKTGKGDLTLSRAGGPMPGARRERIHAGGKGFWKEQKHMWRNVGMDIATTITAEVASAIASSLGSPPRPPQPGGPPPPPEPPPRPEPPSAAESSPSVEPSAPPPSVEPAAPPPPPLDLSGPLRSSQTPMGPEEEKPDPMLTVLEAVARGEITPQEAEVLLAASRHGARAGGPV